MGKSNTLSDSSAVRQVIFENSPSRADISAYERHVARERSLNYGSERERINKLARLEALLQSSVLVLGVFTLAALGMATWTVHQKLAKSSVQPHEQGEDQTWESNIGSLLASFGAADSKESGK